MGINSPSPRPLVAIAATWTAIHEAAATVGAIAGVEPQEIAGEVQSGLRAELPVDAVLDQSMQDLAEIMRRGISALLTAHVSGGTPQAAALALWAEFLSARCMVLEISDRQRCLG